MTVDAGTPARRSRSRRDEILQIAVVLFASRGYHGVSMDDIGAAAGVTGPALYHHFAGKDAMLVAALIPVSDRLLARGRECVDRHPGDPKAAIEELVEFHVDFALDEPAVIALHLHELDRLPDEPRRKIRRLQRLVRRGVGRGDQRAASAPHRGRGPGPGPRGVRPDELDPVHRYRCGADSSRCVTAHIDARGAQPHDLPASLGQAQRRNAETPESLRDGLSTPG